MKQLIQICRTVNANWNERAYGGKPIFMFDNPSFHNLSEEDIATLKHEGAITSRSQIQRPPEYSGDFMQCIEHAHAIIAEAWWHHRLMHGTTLSWRVQKEQLDHIRLTHVTADVVARNVDKVVTLVEYIAEQGTGGYARSHMT